MGERPIDVLTLGGDATGSPAPTFHRADSSQWESISYVEKDILWACFVNINSIILRSTELENSATISDGVGKGVCTLAVENNFPLVDSWTIS
jgi:hypothetical protein